MPHNGKQYFASVIRGKLNPGNLYFLEPSCSREAYAPNYQESELGTVQGIGYKDNFYEASSNCYEVNVMSRTGGFAGPDTCFDYSAPESRVVCELNHLFYIPAEMQFPLRITSSLPEN